MVDSAGQVVGIVTLETGAEDGDNFAFALPVSIVHDLLEQTGIQEVTTKYQALVREGLALQDERHCKKAHEAFTSARTMVEGNVETRKPLDMAIEECNVMIATGKSIDNIFDELIEALRRVRGMTWVLIILGTVLAVFVTIGSILLLRQLSRNRTRIHALENEIEDQVHDHEKTPEQATPVAASPMRTETAAVETPPAVSVKDVPPPISTPPPATERQTTAQENELPRYYDDEAGAPPTKEEPEENGSWFINDKPV